MSKKFLKAGILIGILVVPAFIFIFLDTFGDNKFDLPYYFPELNESGNPIVIDGDTLFHQIKDFTLINQTGDSVSLVSLDSNIKVVNFFFTRCGTICPIISGQVKRVADNFSKEENLNFLSITVDPEYDRVSVLKKYSESMDSYTENWNFLTGDKAYIYDLAIKNFKLPVADASVYDSTIVDVDDAFIHSDKVLLLDSKNFIRGIYEGTDKDDMARLLVEIKVLLDGLEKK